MLYESKSNISENKINKRLQELSIFVLSIQVIFFIDYGLAIGDQTIFFV